MKRLALMLALWLVLPVVLADELELAAVIANVAVQPPARIAFEEQRHSSLLKQPLLLTGYLEYLSAGSLQKTIDTPFQESVLIDRKSIEVSRDGRSRRLSLKANVMMQTMLGGIEALLAGDTASLEKHFVLSLQGEPGAWRLQLIPRAQRVAKQLQYLQVSGDAQRVHTILIQFDEQDWQQMNLQTEPLPYEQAELQVEPLEPSH